MHVTVKKNNREFRVCNVLGTGIFGCCLLIRILYHENIDYSSGSRLHMPSSSTSLPNVFHICRENIRGDTSILNVWRIYRRLCASDEVKRICGCLEFQIDLILIDMIDARKSFKKSAPWIVRCNEINESKLSSNLKLISRRVGKNEGRLPKSVTNHSNSLTIRQFECEMRKFRARSFHSTSLFDINEKYPHSTAHPVAYSIFENISCQ